MTNVTSLTPLYINCHSYHPTLSGGAAQRSRSGEQVPHSGQHSMVNDGGNDDVSSDDSTSDIEDDDDDEFLSLLKTRWSSVKRYLSRHRVAEIFNF